ncbi:hypothetical protein DIPPA_55505, partial [Diplonema papillatum]
MEGPFDLSKTGEHPDEGDLRMADFVEHLGRNGELDGSDDNRCSCPSTPDWCHLLEEEAEEHAYLDIVREEPPLLNSRSSKCGYKLCHFKFDTKAALQNHEKTCIYSRDYKNYMVCKFCRKAIQRKLIRRHVETITCRRHCKICWKRCRTPEIANKCC